MHKETRDLSCDLSHSFEDKELKNDFICRVYNAMFEFPSLPNFL